MSLLRRIIDSLPSGEVESVHVGLHWTCVQIQTGGQSQYGLASTLEADQDSTVTDLSHPDGLVHVSGLDLARRTLTAKGPMASAAMAAINALMPRLPEQWVDINAEEIIAQRGAGKKVAMVGRFPFADRLRPRVGELMLLERRPQDGEYPAEAAPEIIPLADVVAITGMTVVNGSLDGLLELCRSDSLVILLGPTTPLSPILFDHGVDILAGAIVEKPEPVIRALQEGGNFRQLHRAGVRLVTMTA